MTTNAVAQSKDSLKTDTLTFINPEVPPSFPGGIIGLNAYIDENFSWTQGQLTVKGKVFVEFIVDKEGNVKLAKVMYSLCESCDKEALRLVENMPQWSPGTINGKKVETRMILPIRFE